MSASTLPSFLQTIVSERAAARTNLFAEYAKYIRTASRSSGEMDIAATKKLSDLLTSLNMPVEAAAQDHADLLELVEAETAALDLPAAREAYETNVKLDRDTSIKFALDREVLAARMRILSQHSVLSAGEATEMQTSQQNLVPAELKAREVIQAEGKLLYRKMMLAGDADARAKALRAKLQSVLSVSD